MDRLLLALALGLLLASTASAGPTPSIRVSTATPLTVVGQSFAPGERLRLVVRYDGIRKVRFLRAGVTGRFTARFAEQTIEDRCSVGATVTRASGRTVTAKLPTPLCPMPLAP